MSAVSASCRPAALHQWNTSGAYSAASRSHASASPVWTRASQLRQVAEKEPCPPPFAEEPGALMGHLAVEVRQFPSAWYIAYHGLQGAIGQPRCSVERGSISFGEVGR